MDDLKPGDERDLLGQWLFNTELECSGASLAPLMEIAIGGAVLKIADLLTVLRYAVVLDERARLQQGEGA